MTLSACETAVGEIKVGEGVYSLNRAFLESGANSVLSTLWSISDDGTNEFMQRFYGILSKMPSTQAALQYTQRQLRKDSEWSDPFFWAPFIMIGYDPASGIYRSQNMLDF